MDQSWQKVQGYRSGYHSITLYEGKRSESKMIYSFLRPDKVRMDIELPKKGAVLLYNAVINKEVQVRPFPGMPFFVLKYDLKHPRVSSDSGRTVAQSHIGGRIESVCGELRARLDLLVQDEPNRVVITGANPFYKKILYLNANALPWKVEDYDESGKVVSLNEFTDIEVNPLFNPDLFTKF